MEITPPSLSLSLRLAVHPSLAPPSKPYAYRRQKKVQAVLTEEKGEKEKKRVEGGGEEANVRINLYSLQQQPFPRTDLEGERREGTFLHYCNVKLSVPYSVCMRVFQSLYDNVQ